MYCGCKTDRVRERGDCGAGGAWMSGDGQRGTGAGEAGCVLPIKVAECEGPMRANVACPQWASNLGPYSFGMTAPHQNGLRFSCGASAGSPQRALTIGGTGSMRAQ